MALEDLMTERDGWEEMARLLGFEDDPNCLNCGRGSKQPSSMFCKRCNDVADSIDAALEEGIVIEYRDGSKSVMYKDRTEHVPS